MRTIYLFLLSLLPLVTFGQEKDTLEAWYKRGIVLHDADDFKGAIKLYDQIIKADKNYYLAYYEKSYSLLADGQYDDCIDLCKKILKNFPYGETNAGVYVNYGTALDDAGKPDKAIKIYGEGMEKFPTVYLLPFNKGITEYTHKDYAHAVADLERSATLKPSHASSHLYLAYSIYPDNKMAAALPLMVFMLLEPEGKRAEKNLPILQNLLGNNVKKGDSNHISITLPISVLDTTKTEDDFHLTEMLMSLGVANEIGKVANVTATDKLRIQLEFFADSESKKGFFSTYYLPFLQAMKQQDQLDTACRIMYASTVDMDNRKWLEANKVKIEAFYKWMSAYDWLNN